MIHIHVHYLQYKFLNYCFFYLFFLDMSVVLTAGSTSAVGMGPSLPPDPSPQLSRLTHLETAVPHHRGK